MNGCTDTNDNSADFSTGSANPRNSATAANNCGGSTNPSGVGAANPSTVAAGGSTLLTVTVTPGTNPPSTRLAVTGDLTLIGGGASQAFYDDGTHGDLTPGNNVFSFQATVGMGTGDGMKTLPVTITDAQTAFQRGGSMAIERTGSTSIMLTVSTPTNPTGIGAANPSSVAQGGSTLLTVNVTPGTNPTSTGLAVASDLTAIGGGAAQTFYDDGTHGDVTAGNNVFSFQATVSMGTSVGAKNLPATITDAQSRSGSANISLTVQPAPTNPSGVGAANPSTVPPGGSTLLTVTVTPGANPTSTGLTVAADLTAIGGGATQAFFDDGTNGDVTAGDNVFSFQATVNMGTSSGGKILPATITDAQSRSGSANISLTVQPAPTNPSGTGASDPSSVQPGATSLLTVTVTPGANPTSTGLAVSANLTAIGGSATQPLYDDGTHGDVTAGDHVFSFQATVDAGTSAGTKNMPATITDAQSRSGSATLTLEVQPPAAVSSTRSASLGLQRMAPNPVTRDLLVEFSLPSEGPARLELLDISGRVAAAREVGSWGVGLHRVLMSEPARLAPGLYLVRLTQNGRSKFARVVVAH